MRKVISVLMVLGLVWIFAVPSLISQEKEFDYDEWEKKPGNVRITPGIAVLSGDGEYVHTMLAFANEIKNDKTAEISLKELLEDVARWYKDGEYHNYDPLNLCAVVIDTTRLKPDVCLFSPVVIEVYNVVNPERVVSSFSISNFLISNFSHGHNGNECLVLPAKIFQKGHYKVKVKWYAWPEFNPEKTQYKIQLKKSCCIDLYITD